MAGPWEKYQAQQAPSEAGPWQKYGKPKSAAQDTLGELAGQGMSGVNEGIANFLSLPNTIEMGLRSIGPGIGNLFGGDFAMPDKSMLPDAGAAYRGLADEVGAIRPETDDMGGKVARRVGEEIGASLFPILGTPAKATSLVAAIGSGLGAAGADLVAPDNPAAEIAGQLVGGLAPLAIANTLERTAIRKAGTPTVERLKTEAGDIYDSARDSGFIFTTPEVNRVADDIAAAAMTEGLDPTLHQGATAALKRLQDAKGRGMTVQDAMTMRRVLSAAMRDPTNPDQARIASEMLRKFDDFTSTVPELAQANSLYARAKRAETLETAIELAASRASGYTGSGFENALRTEFRALERQIIKGQLKGFSEEEIEAISKVARGGPVENILRYIGKLAPTGVVSMGMTGGVPFMVGSAFGVPAAGAAAAAGTMGMGMAARAGATKMTADNARRAVVEALTRGSPVNVPLVGPDTASAAAALGVTQAANQNQAQNEIARLLALN